MNQFAEKQTEKSNQFSTKDEVKTKESSMVAMMRAKPQELQSESVVPTVCSSTENNLSQILHSSSYFKYSVNDGQPEPEEPLGKELLGIRGATESSDPKVVDPKEELKNYKASIKNLEEELGKQNEQIQNLLQELLKQEKIRCRGLQERIEKLESQIKEKDKRIEELEGQLQEKDYRMVELENQVQEKDDSLEEMKQRIKTLNENRTTLKADYSLNIHEEKEEEEEEKKEKDDYVFTSFSDLCSNDRNEEQKISHRQIQDSASQTSESEEVERDEMLRPRDAMVYYLTGLATDNSELIRELREALESAEGRRTQMNDQIALFINNLQKKIIRRCRNPNAKNEKGEQRENGVLIREYQFLINNLKKLQ